MACVLETHSVVPLHKRGIVFDKLNYRGVHLTTTLSKVVERLVVHIVSPFLDATSADISGAFEKVSNEVLLGSVTTLASGPALLKFMRSYLSPRAFHVVLHGASPKESSYSQFCISRVRARSHIMEPPYP